MPALAAKRLLASLCLKKQVAIAARGVVVKR
jgi:hypothetical protein